MSKIIIPHYVDSVDNTTEENCSIFSMMWIAGCHQQWRVRNENKIFQCLGFSRLLESPGFFWWNFQALESPGKWVWSWKVLEILVKGPGKSWNFLDYDVGGGQLCRCRCQNLRKLANILSVYVKEIVGGLRLSQHSNCCLSLYLNIAGIRQGSGKMFLGPGKSWKFV